MTLVRQGVIKMYLGSSVSQYIKNIGRKKYNKISFFVDFKSKTLKQRRVNVLCLLEEADP